MLWWVFLHRKFLFPTSSTEEDTCQARVPVKCEMKRETKYTETEGNEIYQNETK